MIKTFIEEIGKFFEGLLKVVQIYLKHLKIKSANVDETAKKFYFCMMNRFKDFIEWQAFGVLTAIGEKMGIATSRIRTWFMYTSLLTMGSPIIIYMILAFWMNMKRYIKARRRNPIWYL